MLQREKGFTITELSLAMSGLSILLIILISSAIAVTSIYNKGLVLKGANQSGRNIGEDFQRSLRQASDVKVRREPGFPPTALCTGKVSYIWTAQHKQAASVKLYNYYAAPSATPRAIGLARVIDSGTLCDLSYDPNGKIVASNYTNADKLAGRLEATEMLSDNLSVRYVGNAVTGITGLSIVQAGANKLTTFEYTIGSTDGEDFIDDGTQCKGGEAGEFCALNTFTVTAYARYSHP